MIDKNRDGIFSANAHLDSSGSLIDREAFQAHRPFFVDQAPYEVALISSMASTSLCAGLE